MMISRLKRWWNQFRHEGTGRFISREQAAKLDPRDVMRHRRERKAK